MKPPFHPGSRFDHDKRSPKAGRSLQKSRPHCSLPRPFRPAEPEIPEIPHQAKEPPLATAILSPSFLPPLSSIPSSRPPRHPPRNGSGCTDSVYPPLKNHEIPRNTLILSWTMASVVPAGQEPPPSSPFSPWFHRAAHPYPLPPLDGTYPLSVFGPDADYRTPASKTVRQPDRLSRRVAPWATSLGLWVASISRKV